MILQAADKVHVRGLEILRGQGDGKLHLLDCRIEVALGDSDACSLIVPNPSFLLFEVLSISYSILTDHYQ